MEVKLVFWNSQELAERDASLTLGFISFELEGLCIDFFKERKCYVLLTISSLLDFLINPKLVEFRWVGEGGGDLFNLRKRRERLEIENVDKKVNVSFNLKDVQIAVQSSMINLLSLPVIQNNPWILEEGMFIEFNESLELSKQGKDERQ